MKVSVVVAVQFEGNGEDIGLQRSLAGQFEEGRRHRQGPVLWVGLK